MEKKAKHPGGRPISYTPELARWICDIVATHPVGISTIKSMYPEFPAHTTINEWRLKYPEFSSMYFEARSQQAQLLVEEIDEMIPAEIKYYLDDKGNERIDSPSASLVIAKINNRKWTAARLAPKVYGDQKQVEELTADKERLKQELEELRKKLDEKNQKEY